ncbi:MAG TPA: carbon-nitrogen hydrolase, partial [Ignavibacteriales bacterium]|nr:carbon-nitrogen hydrolase [Ignavibacteriales bacterium]
MTNINIKDFEKRIVVRQLSLTDYDEVVELQKKCFPGMKTWSMDQFSSQIEIFNEGQICVEYENKIVASSSSLVLDFNLYSEWHSWTEIADNGFIRN